MVVLVLRGLMGTAMAAGVLPPVQPAGGTQHGSHVTALASTGAESAAQPHDHQHAGHGEHAPAAAEADAACHGDSAACGAHEHHAATCSACEICHSAMLDVPSLFTHTHHAPGTLRAHALAPFDSAPAARAIKPPIA